MNKQEPRSFSKPQRWNDSCSVLLNRTLNAVSAPNNRTMITSLLVWACLILGAMVALSTLYPSRGELQLMHVGGLRSSEASPSETLVIYTYSKSDLQYEHNLNFFVEHGMWEGDGCQYIIIVQQGKSLFGETNLPALPSNAQYVYHENECYDWGTFGWLLTSGRVGTSKFQYFIFMNSSVRGPFLPPYWPASVHWSNIYLSRLTDDVKLVGSTISCEPAWQNGDSSQPIRQNPHVQSYVMATDQVGLEVLREDQRVFGCYSSIHDTIWHSELGASRAIFKAGYTIDSLMLRYQGLDWRDASNGDCNARLNPYAEFAYDGIVLNPMEVLFIKVKNFAVDARWTTPHTAVTYDRWMSTKSGSASSNRYEPQKAAYRFGKIAHMAYRGPACFDQELYLERNRDLVGVPPPHRWWHFVVAGQFEGRQFRFTCPDRMFEPGVAQRAIDSFLVLSHEVPENNLDPAAQIVTTQAVATQATRKEDHGQAEVSVLSENAGANVLLGQEERDTRAIDDRLAQAAGFIDAELRMQRASLADEEAAAAVGEAANRGASQARVTKAEKAADLLEATLDMQPMQESVEAKEDTR